MILHKYTKTQLAILSQIAKEEYCAGDKLLSERDFSQIFPFSRITVHHALADLVTAGYLEKRPKSGYYLLRPITSIEHQASIGFLAIGRSERMPDGYPKNSLFKNVPFQPMKNRGLDIVARYEEEISFEMLRSFSNCIGLLVTDWVTDEWVSSLRGLNIPLYCVGNNLCRKEHIPTIDNDHEYVAKEIVSRIIGYGCRKIVLVIGSCEMPSAVKVEKAYRETLAKHGIPFEERRIVKMRYLSEEEDFLEGLARNSDCDAVAGGRVPSILQYQKLGWSHIPRFASLTNVSPIWHKKYQGLYPYFSKDIFNEAANILADHLLLDMELPEQILIRPEIHDQE